MTSNKTYWIAVLQVLLAGIFWATGPLFVKFSLNPQQYIIKYLWLRMFSLCILYTIKISIYFQFQNTGNDTIRSLLSLSGMSTKWKCAGIIGLACAMSGFVVSLAFVPAANTLCELAAAPFFAAIIEKIVLKQNVSKLTLICMLLSFFGLVLFAFEGVLDGNATSSSGSSGRLDKKEYRYVLGNTLGITSSIGVAIYTVALRFIPKNVKSTSNYGIVMSAYGALTVIIGATLGFSIDSLVNHSFISIHNATNYNYNTTTTTTTTTTTITTSHRLNPFDMPSINIWLSVGHACFIFAGFIFYTLGSSSLPAPETVLLSMLEVVGGVLLTFIFVGEYPGTWGVIGTVLTTIAVLVNGIGNGLIKKIDDENDNVKDEIDIEMKESSVTGSVK